MFNLNKIGFFILLCLLTFPTHSFANHYLDKIEINCHVEFRQTDRFYPSSRDPLLNNCEVVIQLINGDGKRFADVRSCKVDRGRSSCVIFNDNVLTFYEELKNKISDNKFFDSEPTILHLNGTDIGYKGLGECDVGRKKSKLDNGQVVVESGSTVVRRGGIIKKVDIKYSVSCYYPARL